ncbi:diphosphomevalonate decarboxylase [Kitasatospora brasiliensis]|uniref:diphosphomevalonate decarboxylase n=1 Tax=Kitasatospora brasiliensis TaxID=3058040 RepID=UPI00292D7503|nr:diphosphomevalonate decarboxylase [Kitasatospora sp. K002]
MTTVVWAVANANVALVKYWGRAPGPGHQPAGTSLSLTLEGLASGARVARRPPRAGADRVAWAPPGPVAELGRFVAHARAQLGIEHPLDVVVTSNFPVAAGLASSASAYAALTTALAALATGRPSADRLAALARQGSGSACRSMLGGFVQWRPGDDVGAVTQVAPPEHWPLAVLVAVTAAGPKRVPSREGMRRTRASSPFFEAWLAAGEADLAAVREAVRSRDLPALGAVAERNALRMHATALGADPPLLYWEAATVSVIRQVWRLREGGVPAFFTVDAGPQVKVLCEPGDAERVGRALADVPGVLRVLRSRPGGAPRTVPQPPSWALSGGLSQNLSRDLSWTVGEAV